MYFQNPPSPQGPHAPQGLAAPQTAQPLLPPSPPTLPATPPLQTSPQSSTLAQRPASDSSPRTLASGSLRGQIVPQSLRYYSNGVSRFRFCTDDPAVQLISCVMFKNTSESLPAGALSVGRHLELRGYVRANNWTDKQGNAHSGKDFVVKTLITL